MARLLERLGWWLLPGTCLLCELPSGRPRDICKFCEDSLPWCNSPLLPPRSQHPVIAAFHYRRPVDGLLQKLKFHNGFLENRVLTSLLAERLTSYYSACEIPAEMPDLILPVPLAWPRLLRRGYNQAGIIASRLSRELNIPVDYHTLLRSRNTRAQSSLNREQRRRNLHAAFRLGKTLPSVRIALVDDIFTTGATLDSAARCLTQAGVESVHYWVLARTDLKHSVLVE